MYTKLNRKTERKKLIFFHFPLKSQLFKDERHLVDRNYGIITPKHIIINLTNPQGRKMCESKKKKKLGISFRNKNMPCKLKQNLF